LYKLLVIKSENFIIESKQGFLSEETQTRRIIFDVLPALVSRGAAKPIKFFSPTKMIWLLQEVDDGHTVVGGDEDALGHCLSDYLLVE
jgi:hypothetical protein